MSAAPPQNQGVYGQQRFGDENTPFNELHFFVTQILARLNVATLVQVVGVHAPPEGVAIGTIDISPMVNQVDGEGHAWPHTTVYNVPYLRVQGGKNAVICDPQIGDIGMCVFADRDISRVMASQNNDDPKPRSANPGSRRRFDMSDALYLGGWNLKVAPERYLLINDDGITIMAGASKPISVTASKFTINGDLEVTGDITAGGAHISSVHHKHSGVTTGTGTSGEPV